MEMMVVLLIVAIIAAATAPMVTKKMSRNAGTGDSPWVFTGLNNSIAYNMNGSDASAIIGTSRYNRGNNGPQYPRLVLASGNDGQHPAFAFADANGNFSGQMNMNQASGIVTMNNAAVGNNSTAIGMGQTILNSPTGIVAIGQGVNVDADADDSIAIGRGVEVSGLNTIAIGNNDSNNDADRTCAIAENSIAIGQSSQATAPLSIALGHGATANNTNNPNNIDGAIAIGNNAEASSTVSIAIGSTGSGGVGNTIASGQYSTAIGSAAKATEIGATALGYEAVATAQEAIAIGEQAEAAYKNSIAIGPYSRTTAENQIVIGSNMITQTVYIPGNLIVEGGVWLGRSGIKNAEKRVYLNVNDGNGLDYGRATSDKRHTILTELSKSEIDAIFKSSKFSDRRLKNVGEKYTAGLAELKQLDFFHYTFKKDEAKTPHVGVMAQDLEKVFPDAVTKGEDGYLRIRFEDMFYAVINAVKELDNKITEIVENITQINSTDKKQNETIETLQNTIEEQQELIKKLEKRIEKLEKNLS